MVTYTDPGLVSDMKRTPQTPIKGRTVSGYGAALPTPYMVRYDGRWMRVKVMAYANSGCPYIVSRGQILHLDTDTEHALQRL